MRMIAGFLTPTSGSAKVCGFDVLEQPIEVKARIGYLPEGAPLYADMTPKSFLAFVAAARGYRGDEAKRRIHAAAEETQIFTVFDRPIDTLSKGYKRRVGLAQALLHDPEVLILDEPTDGLDPNQKHEVRSLIREMAPHKTTVISTHLLDEVSAVCTRAIVIAGGRLVIELHTRGARGALAAPQRDLAQAQRPFARGRAARSRDRPRRRCRRCARDGGGGYRSAALCRGRPVDHHRGEPLRPRARLDGRGDPRRAGPARRGVSRDHHGTRLIGSPENEQVIFNAFPATLRHSRESGRRQEIPLRLAGSSRKADRRRGPSRRDGKGEGMLDVRRRPSPSHGLTAAGPSLSRKRARGLSRLAPPQRCVNRLALSRG